MAVYSIKDLEKLSSIKAHTLRIWEQRYGIIKPKRTSTNIRYYEDEDLKLILNIALLNKNGVKISKIAKMSPAEIAEKVAAISEFNFEFGTQLDALTISMIEMDEYKFNRIINTNIQQQGFERTMMEVIYPFLEKLRLLWLTGSINPVQENFISNLIRQKIIASIDQEPLPAEKNSRLYLLFLPEGERQELSMLFMHYLLKSRKNRVIYVGQDMNISDIRDACKIHQPDFIYTIISESFSREPIQQYVNRLSEQCTHAQLLLSGYQLVAQPVQLPDNTLILKSLNQTLDFIDAHSIN